MKIKSFRLSEDTQKQIAWLAHRKGVSATDVIREAVADMFHREVRALPGFVLQEDLLLLNGKPVIHCSPRLLAELPEDLLSKLREGTAEPAETLLYLILNAARLKESLEYDAALLRESLGFDLKPPSQRNEQE